MRKEEETTCISCGCKDLSKEMRDKFHANTKGKLFVFNYQLCTAMQQMGNGPTDMSVLSGFIDFSRENTLKWHMKSVESVVGEVQEYLKDIQMKEAVEEEIDATIK